MQTNTIYWNSRGLTQACKSHEWFYLTMHYTVAQNCPDHLHQWQWCKDYAGNEKQINKMLGQT